MRTTINIDDNLFHDLLVITKAKTKTEAVKKALIEYLNSKKKEKVLSLRGKVNLSESWSELRKAEIDELNGEL